MRPQPISSGCDESPANSVVLEIRKGCVYLSAIRHRRGNTPERNTHLQAMSVDRKSAFLSDLLANVTSVHDIRALWGVVLYLTPKHVVIFRAILLLPSFHGWETCISVSDGTFSPVRIGTRIQVLIRQRPTKASFHQWIEPPEDGPVENTTRHLGRKLSILRKEDRSLLPGLGGQDDRFNGSGRS